jgi:formylglycine-generating enzyme required for sulfatase activity
VGSYSPNNFGIYDVHGNVWEWVSDCYRDSYGSSALNVPTLTSCSGRVIRGGSFRQSAMSARLSNRESLAEDDANDQVGFRIVKER